MSAIRLTTKRQATLPKQLCEEMGVRSGDVIQVEAATVKGERVWYLKPSAAVETPWFGRLKGYAKGKAHKMTAIRKSIARRRMRGGK